MKLIIIVFCTLILFSASCSQQDSFGRVDAVGLNEMAQLLSQLKVIQHEFFMIQGQFPASNQDAGLNPGNELQNSALRRLDILSDQRVLLTFHHKVDDQRVIAILSPEMTSQFHLIWHCRSPNLTNELKKYLFKDCAYSSEYLVGEHVAQRQLKRLERKQKTVAKTEVADEIQALKARYYDEPLFDNGIHENTEQLQLICKGTRSDDMSFALWTKDDQLKLWKVEENEIKPVMLPVQLEVAEKVLLTELALFFESHGKLAYVDFHNRNPELKLTEIPLLKHSQLFYSNGHLVISHNNDTIISLDICSSFIPDKIKLPIHSTYQINDYQIVNDLAYILAVNKKSDISRSIFTIFDFKSSANNAYTRSYPFKGSAKSFEVVENKIYIANGDEGIKVLNLEGKEIKEIGSASTKDFANDIAIVEDFIFVADRAAGLAVFDSVSLQPNIALSSVLYETVKEISVLGSSKILIKSNTSLNVYKLEDGKSLSLLFEAE